MQPFSSHTGIAVPMIEDDINTDQMAPVQAMREMKPDYKKMLFIRTRGENPDFVLNKPQFANPGILVTGNNFGAGSSREAAVWSMLANNIRVIVAKCFADIVVAAPAQDRARQFGRVNREGDTGQVAIAVQVR